MYSESIVAHNAALVQLILDLIMALSISAAAIAIAVVCIRRIAIMRAPRSMSVRQYRDHSNRYNHSKRMSG
jgi:hypothetical protein